MATKQEVIALDAERKSRRGRLADRVGNAREKLAPSKLAAKIGDEQKAKVRDAGKRAGAFTKDHKYAIGGGFAALAAGAAGLFFWRRQARKDGLEGEPTSNTPSNKKVEEALANAKPVGDAQASPAAGAAV